MLFSSAAQSQEREDEEDGSSVGEVSLSNDTLQFRYITGADRVADDSRASVTLFLSESRDIVVSADLLFPGRLDIDRLQIGFGPRMYAALLEDENQDILALSLGVDLRYELERRTGLAIAGQAFYAPDILTFGSADNLTDLSARVEIRLQPQLTVFGGMRWFEFDLTPGFGEGTRTLQEELFVGVGWRF